MLLGIFFGVLAGALWGSTYLLPLILDQYGALYITFSRATIMGATAVVGLWVQRRYLRQLTRADWKFAFVLTMVGNVLQCLMLMLCVEYGGAVLAGMCFGLCPVLIAIIANERDRAKGKLCVPVSKLVLPVLFILAGLVLANWSELVVFVRNGRDPLQFFVGLVFGLISTAMWTWYPIRNADWLLDHPKVSPVFWTSFQCAMLFPIGLALYLFTWAAKGDLPGLMGPSPVKFAFWMLFAGIFCSWGATALWNEMSQRIPTSLVGQMLVFESIFSIVFAHLYDWRLPAWQLIAGMALMLGAVSYSLHLFESQKKMADPELCEVNNKVT